MTIEHNKQIIPRAQLASNLGDNAMHGRGSKGGPKIQDDDEGGIIFGCGYDRDDDMVRVEFGRSITTLGLTKEQAIEFGKRLIWAAGREESPV